MKHSCFLIMLFCLPVSAEVITDGTTGKVQNLSGQMIIPQSLGTTAGQNLFHSFKTFNVQIGESAKFTGSNALKNVISRVTGGNLSTINGLLQSTIGHANFYFINPTGITFGGNAKVDVPAAFHVSTADSLRFADGKEFSATDSTASHLSIAEPISFGFLGTSTIQNGLIALNNVGLSARTGQTLDIVAGNINASDAAADGNITAPGGEIRLVAVQKTASVSLKPTSDNTLSLPNTLSTVENGGDISILHRTLMTDGDSGGHIALWGRNIAIPNDFIVVGNWGNTDAKPTQGVDIYATHLDMSNGATILAGAYGTGNAGDIRITTDTMQLDNYAWLQTDVGSSGNAGNITVQANHLKIDNGSGISTNTYPTASPNTYPTGNAGNITVQANHLNLDNGGRILSQALTYSTLPSHYAIGKAANIIVQANNLNIDNGGSISSTSSTASNASNIAVIADNLELMNGGSISSDTNSTGNAGNVQVSADNLTIDGQSIQGINTGILSQAGTGSSGQAGNVSVIANKLDIIKGGSIHSDTLSTGNAGNVTVSADSLKIVGTTDSDSIATGISSQVHPNSSGHGGFVAVTAKTLDIFDNAKIEATTVGIGNAGSVKVNAETLNIHKNSHISSSTFATGHAGSVEVIANSLKIDGGNSPFETGILSDASPGYGGIASTGNAGSVTVKAGNLEISNSGVISSDTWSSGNAGDVVVTADKLIIDGQHSDYATGIVSDAAEGSHGKAGSVSVTANTIDIRQNGSISSASKNGATADYRDYCATQGAGCNGWEWWKPSASGQAGNVTVTATKSLQLANQGKITVQNDGIASDISSIIPANLTIDTPSLIMNGGIITAATSGNVNAGNISITAPSISMDHATITAKTTATGNAGSITLTGNKLAVLNGSQLRSDTYAQGDANQTVINVGEVLIDRQKSNSDTGIFSDAQPNSTGKADLVTITADKLTLLRGGEISSNTDGKGNAGEIIINSKEVLIDGADSGANITGLASDASPKSSGGHAGSITVTSDNLTVRNSGQISSDTHSQGNAGSVMVTSGNLTLVNAGTISSSAEAGSGNAGDVDISANNTLIDGQYNPAYTGVFSDTYKSSTGKAGTVEVLNTGNVTLLNLGQISSSTWSKSNAGDVLLKADNLFVDGKDSGIFAAAHALGQSGKVDIQVNNAIKLANQGKISIENTPIENNTAVQNLIGKPTAAALTIAGSTLELDHGMITAKTSGDINAGSVTINATRSLSAKNQSTINSSTLGAGSAGKLTVTAPVMTLDNADISSEASAGSGGQTNDVTVTATQGIYLSNSSRISMKDDATISKPSLIKPTGLLISAPDIDLTNSSMTTASTGNVDAGNITLNFSHWLTLDSSFITTAATDGNGGSIAIDGGGELINLQNSGFLTSVSGANGNGGNINVATDFLIMNSGVIQANALAGKGGDIALNLKALISSYDSLIRGGSQVRWQPYMPGFNVIQAASATGISGNINITSPQFNISGVISGLNSGSLVLPNLDRGGCRGSLYQVSSLVRSGKGGIPANEAKTGFIPGTSRLPGIEASSSTNLSSRKHLATDLSKLENDYPCATALR